MDIDTSLKQAMEIQGAKGVCLVDLASGMALGQAGGGELDLELAAAGNTEVVRAKLNTIKSLGLSAEIEDILITLTGQFHLIRPLTNHGSEGLFLYLALDSSKANLALARRQLQNVEAQLEI
ncbi:MAG: hypothetical protein V3S75_13955 [Euzebya tangerina]|nr:hypothetical protein [Euzebya tangerina]